jgi:glycosyltransferase involved in cell wall biosynthesis
VRVAIVNYVWDPDLSTPQSLLARFFTLTDWSDAVKRAGAASVTVCQRFHADAALEQNGIRYRFLTDSGEPTPTLWSGGAGALHRAVAAAEPDLVHVNGVLHPRRVRHLRGELTQPTALIVQDHGGFDPCAASRLKRAWIGRGLTVADALLMSSRGQVEEWRRSRIVPQAMSMFDVMESGTTMSPLPKDEARRQSGMEGTPALLWVGRLNDNKDPLTVLSGVSGFFERRPAGRLTMVYAAAELETEVRRKIAGTPALASRVRLIGRVPRQEIPAYFSAADIFVLGSHREGSGYAAIEALACGAILALTDIPSFRTLTADGDVGVLWRPGDVQSLVEALSRAESLVSASARLASRTLFDQRFSWPALGRRAMEIYEEVLSARRRRALQPVR